MSSTLSTTWHKKTSVGIQLYIPLYHMACLSALDCSCFRLILTLVSSSISWKTPETTTCLLLWFDTPMCPMVHPCRRETCTSESLNLLKYVVDNKFKEVDDLRPLLKKNKFGKSVMAVAARCGCYHEVNVWLLSSTSHIGRSQICVRTRAK
jgi:hypothetical protein